MRSKLHRFIPVVAVLWCAQLALGCKCQMSLSSCDEAATSNVVFIGTVESIEPKFLSRWNLMAPSSLRSLNAAYIEAQQHPSVANLERLKQVYLKMFPDLQLPDEKAEKDHTAAKTASDVTSSFYAALDRGIRVRFHVKTMFKHEDDDDDDKEETELDVWNPFGDCGFDFQTGETYLVYANMEESSDYIFTGSCTRTRRLSDAGDDLAYLFFYKNHREESSRLEGFTTSDAKRQSDFDPMHMPAGVASPVADVVIELRSDHSVRYAQPDPNGRFVFDGLSEGDYRVSAFAAGYPMYRQLLAGPRPIEIKEESCAHQILLVPIPPSK